MSVFLLKQKNMALKFTDYMVTFREVPNEISLYVNISNCPIHCPSCHSKELWGDVGEELTDGKILSLIGKNDGCTAFVIGGGDANPSEVNHVAEFIKENSNLLVAWYSGREKVPNEIKLENFDFIKLGPYKKEFGGLSSPKTNQKFFQVIKTIQFNETDAVFILKNITEKFWKET